MKLIFIRHGKTAGNLRKRYIGQTDEPLFSTGISELMGKSYPDCDLVIASPMKRCVQTAALLYPDKEIFMIPDLRECDFGDFEGKNYQELSGNPDYQKWVDSGGKGTFPNGENPQAFRSRCIAAFRKVIMEHADRTSIAFVVHGGTIMSVLEAYAVPKDSYYAFQVANGNGYITEYDGEKITIREQI
ncbi:MAG: histidine phosphatase family protein [Ruminococcus sp.]|nr:histidine phosphatase family protein [Ruminococcus sp.]